MLHNFIDLFKSSLKKVANNRAFCLFLSRTLKNIALNLLIWDLRELEFEIIWRFWKQSLVIQLIIVNV